MDASLFSGVVGLAFLLFLVVLALLWFFLPFAVFGIKDKLTNLEKQLELVNANLAAISRIAEAMDHRARNPEAKAVQPPLPSVE